MIEVIKETASSAIDALKNNPMLLGVLILNAMIFALIYFAVREQRAYMQEQQKLILERCLPKG